MVQIVADDNGSVRTSIWVHLRDKIRLDSRGIDPVMSLQIKWSNGWSDATLPYLNQMKGDWYEFQLTLLPGEVINPLAGQMAFTGWDKQPGGFVELLWRKQTSPQEGVDLNYPVVWRQPGYLSAETGEYTEISGGFGSYDEGTATFAVYE